MNQNTTNSIIMDRKNNRGDGETLDEARKNLVYTKYFYPLIPFTKIGLKLKQRLTEAERFENTNRSLFMIDLNSKDELFSPFYDTTTIIGYLFYFIF